MINLAKKSVSNMNQAFLFLMKMAHLIVGQSDSTFRL